MSERRASAAVAVRSDLMLAQALAMLLPSASYEAGFVPAGASGEPGLLGNVQVVLVCTPGLNAGWGKVLIVALWKRIANMPVLELAACCARAEPRCRAVSRPGSTEELERCTDEVLCAVAYGRG